MTDYLDQPEITEKCRTCNGRGEVPDIRMCPIRWIGCRDCQGRGSVTVQ